MYLTTGGVKQSLQTELWTPIVFNQATEAYYTQLRVSRGALTITHTTTDALISAVVYGFAYKKGYGHSGGFNIRKNFPS